MIINHQASSSLWYRPALCKHQDESQREENDVSFGVICFTDEIEPQHDENNFMPRVIYVTAGRQAAAGAYAISAISTPAQEGTSSTLQKRKVRAGPCTIYTFAPAPASPAERAVPSACLVGCLVGSTEATTFPTCSPKCLQIRGSRGARRNMRRNLQGRVGCIGGALRHQSSSSFCSSQLQRGNV